MFAIFSIVPGYFNNENRSNKDNYIKSGLQMNQSLTNFHQRKVIDCQKAQTS